MQVRAAIQLVLVIVLIPVILISGLLVIRTHLEDKVLIGELNDNDSYSKKVRYRLITGIY